MERGPDRLESWSCCSLFQALGSWGRAKNAREQGKNEGETKASEEASLAVVAAAVNFKYLKVSKLKDCKKMYCTFREGGGG